ncbi:MAG: hypothetical protein KOO60_10890 [Gemmatimonadales bacterium]|nr:hypothetical protein [Gemmatimonadales bacterium]
MSLFEWGTRTSGGRYWARKVHPHDSDWIADLCRDAHGDMFPDDWRYTFIHDALICIEEREELSPDDWSGYVHEAVDGMVDVYNANLTDWLGSHSLRPCYVDQGVGEAGHSETVIQSLQVGQYTERMEVFYSVLNSLGKQLDELEV